MRAGALAGLTGLAIVGLVLIGGKPLIGLVFGQRYLEAYDLLKLMAVSLVVAMAFFPLESLLYMAQRQTAAFLAQLVAVIIYLALLAGLTHAYGLEGAGVAYLAGSIAVALCMLVPTISAYRHRASLPWAVPA